jgi:hypothetical protein
MLHFDIKKFCSHPSTNDIPFRKVDVTNPGAPVGQITHATFEHCSKILSE